MRNIKKKRRILGICISLILLAVCLTGCGSGTAGDTKTSGTASEATPTAAASVTTTGDGNGTAAEKTFTEAELSKFNGKNGTRAYVAVDGTVYDVTELDSWGTGTHQGNLAGRDLSSAIGKSPHGKGMLDRAVVVGKLVK